MAETINVNRDELSEIKTSIAIIKAGQDKQNETLEKLTKAFTQLSVYVEKTNQNDKKIDVLFKKYDDVYNNGTKNCPIHTEKMKNFESDLKRLTTRLDNMQKILVGFAVGVVMQFFGVLIYMLEKHII